MAEQTELDKILGPRATLEIGDLPGEQEPAGTELAETAAPEGAASEAMLRQELEDALSTLNPRERRVLQLRFGLLDGH